MPARSSPHHSCRSPSSAFHFGRKILFHFSPPNVDRLRKELRTVSDALRPVHPPHLVARFPELKIDRCLSGGELRHRDLQVIQNIS